MGVAGGEDEAMSDKLFMLVLLLILLMVLVWAYAGAVAIEQLTNRWHFSMPAELFIIAIYAWASACAVYAVSTRRSMIP